MHRGMVAWSLAAGVVTVVLHECGKTEPRRSPEIPAVRLERFGATLSLLVRYTEVMVLRDASARAQVAVTPEFAGRVMASTYGGEAGPKTLDYACTTRFRPAPLAL